MNEEIFESAKKNFRIKKYSDKGYTSTNNEHVNYVPLSQPTSSVQISDSILSEGNLSLAANIKAWVLAA